MENNNKKEIKKEILNGIKKGEIKMKPCWLCGAQRAGWKCSFITALLILVFLFNALFYYLKTNELLMPLPYGPALWQKILHSLPYDLILIVLAFVVLLTLISRRFDFSYKKPFIFLFLVFTVVILFWAGLLFLTDFNDLLRTNLEESELEVPFWSDFYIRRCGRGG